MAEPLPPRPRGPALALGVLALAAAYVATGKLGLALASVHPSATPVWAPTGLAIAALLLGGLRLWPGVFAGAFVVNATTAGSLMSSLGIATGNTLEALVAAVLVQRFAGGRDAFERARHVFAYALLAGLAAPAVSASLGVASLALTGFAAWGDLAAIWTTWWLGDAAGAIVVAPALVVWLRRPWPRPDPRRAAEAAAFAAGFAALGAAVFLGAWLAGFAVLPLVVAAAYRFGPRGATAATASIASLAIAATVLGLGPIAAASNGDPLLVLQAFMGTIALTGLVLAALVGERARTEAAVRAARDELEARVAERTASLVRAVDELRKREAQLTQAHGIARLGSWEWDVAADRVAWSPELLGIHGLAPAEPGPGLQGYLARVHPDDRGPTEAILRAAMRDGRDFTSDERIVRPDGEVRWLHSGGRVLRDPQGRPARVVGVSHDITDLRRAEEVRRAALGQALENRRLLEIDRLKTEFISAAAHELNTPLTPIRVQLQLLEDALRTGAEAPRQRALVILRRNVDRMVLLVQDMLDVARLQSGRLRLERKAVSLAEAASEAVQTFEELAREQGVELEARVPPGLAVDADPMRLAQVLLNLVSNALKFTPAGGRITVEAARAEGHVEVRVRDTGAGLSQEQLEQLFQPFTQVHTTPGPKGGTGLGLFISKGIVEQHGGRIWAESEGPGRGSTFAFTLREAGAVSPGEGAAPAGASRPAGLT